MRTLLIDNYDSFTGNLFQCLAEVNGEVPLLIRNDQISARAIGDCRFDNIVISPGPGRPDRPADFGVCRDVILEARVPVLGVCLGHQGICTSFGGTIDYAATPVHGRVSEIHHSGDPLFEGLPSPFRAVRYHSLVVTRLPEGFEEIAWTGFPDRINMGLRHRGRPLWGVQFHPESACTEFGRRLFENFLRLTQLSLPLSRRRSVSKDGPRANVVDDPGAAAAYSVPDRKQPARPSLQLRHRSVAQRIDSESMFVSLFGASRTAVWLDAAGSGAGRFSIMADASGPHAEIIRYDAMAALIDIRAENTQREVPGDVFSYIDRACQRVVAPEVALPFEFTGGYVGYLGYEAKADCGGKRMHRAATPDAAFLFADRFLVIDHEAALVHVVCLELPDRVARADDWLDVMERRLEGLRTVDPWCAWNPPVDVALKPRHSREVYRELVLRCQEEIRRGESYEICLTNVIDCEVDVDPLTTYRALRSQSPAPYAAYLRFDDLHVLSSSPERFVRIDRDRVIESKPIKGTRRRGDDAVEDELLRLDLANNEKDRAENLMIVDLVRHDFSFVAEVGSVEVPRLFAVESFSTVHQLVSTVRARLRPGVSGVAAVRAAFPPGSMTGAPKIRTMDIIDRLEQGARGVYSGAIGWFSLNGAVDLGVAIRTIVVNGASVSVGVGGAVVAMSVPDAEVEEMLLKARGTLAALRVTGRRPERARGEHVPPATAPASPSLARPGSAS